MHAHPDTNKLVSNLKPLGKDDKSTYADLSGDKPNSLAEIRK